MPYYKNCQNVNNVVISKKTKKAIFKVPKGSYVLKKKNLSIYKVKDIFLLIGFKIKPNNRFVFWNSINKNLFYSKFIKSRLNDSSMDYIVESISIAYSTQLFTINNLKKRFLFKNTNILFFRLKGFFFYNFIGSIFFNLNKYLNIFSNSRVFLLIQFCNLYNKDRVWSKKKSIKKTKLRHLIQKNKKNVLFKDDSVFN